MTRTLGGSRTGCRSSSGSLLRTDALSRPVEIANVLIDTGLVPRSRLIGIDRVSLSKGELSVRGMVAFRMDKRDFPEFSYGYGYSVSQDIIVGQGTPLTAGPCCASRRPRASRLLR